MIEANRYSMEGREITPPHQTTMPTGHTHLPRLLADDESAAVVAMAGAAREGEGSRESEVLARLLVDLARFLHLVPVWQQPDLCHTIHRDSQQPLWV